MADFSDVEYTSEVDSIDSAGHADLSYVHLRQDYHQQLDVQILDRLTPDNEPPGTSVYSFSEGGDFDMQLSFDDEQSGSDNRDAEQGDDIDMDVSVDDQDLGGWMWQDQDGEVLMEGQGSEGKCLDYPTEDPSWTRIIPSTRTDFELTDTGSQFEAPQESVDAETMSTEGSATVP